MKKISHANISRRHFLTTTAAAIALPAAEAALSAERMRAGLCSAAGAPALLQ